MKNIITENFLLENKVSQRLYHDFAKSLPIVDYHCHINPSEIAENRKFNNITEAWLEGDHYKWRVMRQLGIEEKFVTGDGDDKNKFVAFSKTLERCIGNPLYHWAHLELKRYFNYDGILNSKTAEEVYNHCNKILKQENMSVKSIIEKSNVKLICTTDDPVDSLEHHKSIKKDTSFNPQVLPAFRPDKYINIEKADFNINIDKLSALAKIDNIDDLVSLLEARIDYFHEAGCRVADFGVDVVPYNPCTKHKADEIFKLVRNGGTPSTEQVEAYKTYLILNLIKLMHNKNWVVQVHYGTMRNVNHKAFASLGPDTGFDIMSNPTSIKKLALLLNELNNDDKLPKMIIYSLNPRDNAALDALCGCFYESGVKNKIHHGSAWWFNDTKSGIEDHLISFGNISVLGNFIGMLTDSRSFLSYTRHEYFRRILCNLLGCWVEKGIYPEDYDALKTIVQDICLYNAVEFFEFSI